MARAMEALKKELGPDLRAAATGVNLSVAVTDTELVSATAKLFGGANLTRYSLASISSVEHVPNPSANRLQVRLGPETVMILYGPESAKDFERIVSWLQAAAAKNAELAKADKAGAR